MRALLNNSKRLRLFVALAAGSLTLPAAFAAQASAAPKKSHASSTGTAAAKTGTTKTSKSRKGATRKGKRVKGQAAPTTDRINEIQSALAKKGFYAGDPTGKWDDSSSEAMKKFQSSNGLNPTGKLDALTLQKLGLGSGTAGLGAPTPPPNTSNRLLSSKVQREEAKNENQPE